MTSRGGYVQSFDRGLAVIRAFDADHARLTLSQVAARSGLSRATARRLLHTLVHLGYVTTHAQHFALRHRIRELGDAYLDSLSLPRVAGPHLERLTAQLGLSASMAVLDGADIVYVVRVAARSFLRVDLGIGARLPAAGTAMGRVLLAGAGEPARPEGPVDAVLEEELAHVGTRGWAAVDAEPGTALPTVAVPVHEAGDVVAALGIELVAHEGPVARRVTEVLPALRETARDIGAELVREP